MSEQRMFFVRKPEIVAQNDKIFEQAKEEYKKLPCPVHAGGHEPVPRKLEADLAKQIAPNGWAYDAVPHNGHIYYWYPCGHCRGLYFVPLPAKEDES